MRWNRAIRKPMICILPFLPKFQSIPIFPPISPEACTMEGNTKLREVPSCTYSTPNAPIHPDQIEN